MSYYFADIQYTFQQNFTLLKQVQDAAKGTVYNSGHSKDFYMHVCCFFIFKVANPSIPYCVMQEILHI